MAFDLRIERSGDSLEDFRKSFQFLLFLFPSKSSRRNEGVSDPAYSTRFLGAEQPLQNLASLSNDTLEGRRADFGSAREDVISEVESFSFGFDLRVGCISIDSLE